MKEFDILLPLYGGDTLKIFNRAYNSILENTVKPQKVILVIDGPISKELEAAVEKWREVDSLLHVVKLPINRGIITALNVGLRECTSDYVIRCDSDDINDKERFRRLVETIVKKSCDVLGSEIIEIDSKNRTRYKRMPLNHEAIAKFAMLRNPINHMSVIFNRSKIVELGGYPNVPAKEDYALWLNCLQNNYQLENIDEALVEVNLGSNFEARRKKSAFINEWRLMKYKNKIGFENKIKNFMAFLIRLFLLMMPIIFIRSAYKLLRK